MNHRLIVILIIAGYFLLGVVSPLIRNYLKYKNKMPLEKNIGGFLISKFLGDGVN